MKDIYIKNNLFVAGTRIENGVLRWSPWGILSGSSQSSTNRGVINLVIENNLFYGPFGNAIGVTNGTEATIRNNIFYQSGKINYSGADLSKQNIRNNVIWNVSYSPSSGDFKYDPKLSNPSNLIGPDGKWLTADD